MKEDEKELECIITTETIQKPESNVWLIFLTIIIIIVVIILTVKSCSTNFKNDNAELEQQKIDNFQQQLNTDPNNWTDAQRKEYNNFIEWNTKQK